MCCSNVAELAAPEINPTCVCAHAACWYGEAGALRGEDIAAAAAAAAAAPVASPAVRAPPAPTAGGEGVAAAAAPSSFVEEQRRECRTLLVRLLHRITRDVAAALAPHLLGQLPEVPEELAAVAVPAAAGATVAAAASAAAALAASPQAAATLAPSAPAPLLSTAEARTALGSVPLGAAQAELLAIVRDGTAKQQQQQQQQQPAVAAAAAAGSGFSAGDAKLTVWAIELWAMLALLEQQRHEVEAGGAWNVQADIGAWLDGSGGDAAGEAASAGFASILALTL
jgi:hypothetical protein